MFVFGLILLILAVVGAFVTIALTRSYRKADAAYAERVKKDSYTSDRYKPSPIGKWIALGLTLLVLLGGLGSAIPTLFYSQETRESVQLKDWTGNLVGSTTESGLHSKAPWVDTISFSTGVQQIVFAGPTGSQSNNSGGQAAVPHITVPHVTVPRVTPRIPAPRPAPAPKAPSTGTTPKFIPAPVVPHVNTCKKDGQK